MDLKIELNAEMSKAEFIKTLNDSLNEIVVLLTNFQARLDVIEETQLKNQEDEDNWFN